MPERGGPECPALKRKRVNIWRAQENMKSEAGVGERDRIERNNYEINKPERDLLGFEGLVTPKVAAYVWAMSSVQLSRPPRRPHQLAVGAAHFRYHEEEWGAYRPQLRGERSRRAPL